MQGRHYSGPATIVQGDRTAEVDCEFEVFEHGGMKEWRGQYSGAAIEAEPRADEAELRVEGRAGNILINKAFLGTGSGWFTGSGPPP